MAHIIPDSFRMNLLIYLLIKIILTNNINASNHQSAIDNIGTDINKSKPTEEGNINLFEESSVTADYNRANARMDPDNATNKNRASSDMGKLSGLSLENSQGELWYDQGEHRMRSREKKDNPGNRIRVPEEYGEHTPPSQYRPVDETDNNDSMYINKLDVLRAIGIPLNANINNAMIELDDNNPNDIAKPLFALCKSTKPNALAACLELMTWTDGQHPCSHPITLAALVYCLEKPRFTYNEDMLPRRFVQDDTKDTVDEMLAKKKFFNWAEKRNNHKVVDIPKRIPFHSWGGKRSNQVGTEKIQASRVPFNAWGGKRFAKDDENYDSDSETYDACKRSKLKFHSWGGKRSDRK